jgi:hypothetical protein
MFETLHVVSLNKAGVTMTYLRSYVTGNNDVLNGDGRTTAVSLVRVRRDTSL